MQGWPRQAPQQVPELLVEQLALSELSLAREEQVYRQLQNQPGGLERLTTVWASNREILRRYPPLPMAAGIRQRLRRARQRTALRWLLCHGIPAMAAASLVLLLVTQTVQPPPDDGGVRGLAGVPPPALRSKGTPLLMAFRKRGQEVQRLEHGAEVHPGDLLQIALHGGNQTHGVIVSVDGRGEVTLHFPEALEQSTRLPGQGTRVLPYAFELDNAPDYERFLFFTAQQPIDAWRLVSAIKRKASQLLDLVGFQAGPETLVELADDQGLGLRELILIKRSTSQGVQVNDN